MSFTTYSKGMRTLKKRAISQRLFQHMGVSVTEIIIPIPEREETLPNGRVLIVNRLIAWCKTPLEYMIVDGKPNPFSVKTFPEGDDVWLSVCRRRVREMFDAVWELPRQRKAETEKLAEEYREQFPDMMIKAKEAAP